MLIATRRGRVGGVGAIPHAGVEFFRLNKVRMVVETGFLLPFFVIENDSTKESIYTPVIYGKVALMW
jgi:hypothetical protein